MEEAESVQRREIENNPRQNLYFLPSGWPFLTQQTNWR
jgi:hypothetical protein